MRSASVVSLLAALALVPTVAVTAQERAARPDEIDPNTSRLFFAPTGRTLEAGTAELGDVWLFFPSIGLGITDRVSVAAGVSIIPGADGQLFYVFPKVGVVRSRMVNVAVGAAYVRITNETGYGAGVYGALTLGSEDEAVTLSAGIPVQNADRAKDPLIMAGGELRVGTGLKLLAEGWRLPGEDRVPIIFGVRFIGRRTAFDLGMMRVLGVEQSGFPFIPWVGFSIGIN